MTAPNLAVASFTNGFIPEASGECVAFARTEKDWNENRRTR